MLILIFAVLMCQKMVENVNPSKSFLLILDLFMRTNIICNLQVYLGNCICKNVNTQMIDYLGDNLFESG